MKKATKNGGNDIIRIMFRYERFMRLYIFVKRI